MARLLPLCSVALAQPNMMAELSKVQADIENAKKEVPTVDGVDACEAMSTDPKIVRLCKWNRDQCGGRGYENIVLDKFNYGGNMIRGIKLRKDMNATEDIICVKKECWFQTPLLHHQKLEGTDCDAFSQLGLSLAEERVRGEKSPHFPYIDMLPKEDYYQEFHPAFVNGLNFPKEVSYWDMWDTSLRKCFDQYQKMPAAQGTDLSEPITYEHFKWGYYSVITRNFHTANMVPILDLANAYSGAKADHPSSQTWGDKDENEFCLSTNLPMKAGDEVFADYAGYTQHPFVFLAQYGFYIGSESHDLDAFDAGDACQAMLSDEKNMARLRKDYVPQNVTETNILRVVNDVCDHLAEKRGQEEADYEDYQADEDDAFDSPLSSTPPVAPSTVSKEEL